MESDRMGYLLPALTEAKFENQRDVVLNERRQNYENRPYGLAGMAIVVGALSAGPPISLDDDRRAEDLRAAQLDDVRELLSDLLPPAQRIAGAGGRHRHRRGARLAERLLRRHRSRDEPPRRSWRSRRCPSANVRLLLEDRVELPRLYIGVALPGAVRDGDAELDLVGEVLAQRQDVAAVSRAGVRAADRDRGGGLAELARDRRLLPDRRHRGAGPDPRRGRARDRRASCEPFDRDGPDRRRRWSAAWRRRRRISSTGCRPSAASAGSPIS